MSSDNNYEKILDPVKKKLRPKPEEEKKVNLFITNLVEVLSTIDLGVKFKIKVVGSIAKGTWLSNDHDIDIFLLFPPNKVEEFPKIVFNLKEIVPKELQKKGIIAKPEKKHANYPYLFLRSDNLSIDIVPAVDTELVPEEQKKILTPVDRTPLHTQYVKKEIEKKPELADEIRLLKKFLKTIGTYGSEVKIRGFSGYLCELFVINLGSFINVLKWFSETMFPTVFLPNDVEEPEKKDYDKWKGQPLIFPDPTDKHRNVASVVTLENLLYTKLGAKLFLHRPFTFFFNRIPIKKDLHELLSKEKENSFLVLIELKGINEDIIWSQLWRNSKKMKNFLKESYFDNPRIIPVEIIPEKKYGFLVFTPEKESKRFSEERSLPLAEDNIAQILERMKKLERSYGPLIIENKLVYFEKKEKKKLSEGLKEFISSHRFKWSKSVKSSIKKEPVFVNLNVVFKNYDTLYEFNWKVEEIITGKKPWLRAWEEEVQKKELK